MIHVEFSGEKLSDVVQQMRAFVMSVGGSDAFGTTVHKVEPKPEVKAEPKKAPKPEPVVEVVVVEHPAPEPVAESPAPEAPADEPTEITYDQVRDKVLAFAAKVQNKATVVTFLNKWNVSNANQLDKAKYPAFMAALEEEMAK